MKILYWTDLFLPAIGGVETFSMDLIPALQARGHEVWLLTSMHDDGLPAHERIGTIPVYRFPMWNAIRSSDLRAVIAVKRGVAELKRRFEPDLVHLHFGATAYVHLQSRAAVPAPTLTTVHAIPDSSLGEDSLLGKVVRTSAAVNAVSARGQETLARTFPDCAPRMSYIYYGLGPSELDGAGITPPAFDDPLILCLGRLTRQKGFDLAIEAFARIARDFPRARLMIVGEGVEDASLKQLAAALGVTARINFAGPVPPHEVYRIMGQATLMLLPSRFEGLPLVALQAARMQRPMITSAADGLPELVVHGESGLVLEENTASHLAAAIVTMLRNPAEAIRMGQAAARRFEEHFAFEHCVTRYEKLYRKVVRGEVAAVPSSAHQPAR